MRDLRFTLRQSPGGRSLAGQALALAGLVGVFAFAGPFGTYDAIPPLGRVGYWALTLGINWLLCAVAMRLALRLARAASRGRRMLALAGAALAAAAPGAGVVFTAEEVFRPGYSDPGVLPTIYAAVAVLMLAIGLPAAAFFAGRRDGAPPPAGDGPAPDGARAEGAPANGVGTEEAPAGGAGAGPNRFLDRLPPDIGRDLVCLKMADHYVEAFTTAGSALVLMRFADAVAELEGAGGLRVHRSWWVASRHVSGATRRGGRVVLRLTGGREAPVSRARLAAVRAAGLA